MDNNVKAKNRCKLDSGESTFYDKATSGDIYDNDPNYQFIGQGYIIKINDEVVMNSNVYKFYDQRK